MNIQYTHRVRVRTEHNCVPYGLIILLITMTMMCLSLYRYDKDDVDEHTVQCKYPSKSKGQKVIK